MVLQGEVHNWASQLVREKFFVTDPLANLAEESFSGFIGENESGVYSGFSKRKNEPIEQMVMSIGTNPTFGEACVTLVSTQKFASNAPGSSYLKRLQRATFLWRGTGNLHRRLDPTNVEI